jgi:hypothetical protein
MKYRNFGKYAYRAFMDESERASLCTQCRSCEAKYPQKIQVSELMPVIHATLWNG